MKILYVTRELPYGMAEAHILPEIASHRALGWDVRIAYLKRTDMTHDQGPELLKLTFDEPLLSARVATGAVLETLSHPLKVLGLAAALAKSGNRKNFVQNLVSFPKALWLARVIRREKFDHIHVHWASAPTTYAAFAATLSGTPFSMTAHRYDIAARNLLAWKAQRAKFVRVIDEPGAAEFHAELGPGGKRPLVIHVGVKVPEEMAPRRSGVLSSLKMVAGARLVEKKGHSYLFDGIAQARAAGVIVDLDVFGDGPLEASLRDQVKRLGLTDQIHFRGVSSHEALLGALRAGVYDAATLPSVTGADGDKEGIPVFLMEAMAAGVPVLTTPNGGILELAGNGKGIIVPERDAAAIGSALVNLATDEALRSRLAVDGRLHVMEEFEVERSITRLRELIVS